MAKRIFRQDNMENIVQNRVDICEARGIIWQKHTKRCCFPKDNNLTIGSHKHIDRYIYVRPGAKKC